MMEHMTPWDGEPDGPMPEPEIDSTAGWTLASRIGMILISTMGLWLIILSLGALTGCANDKVTPVQTVTQQVKVEVPAACPAKAEYDRLKAARPVPLSQQPKPPTMTEQIAKSLAQLGLYEAPGAYADQVNAALDRCQNP